MNFINHVMKVFCILGVFLGISADSAGMRYKTEDSDRWIERTPVFGQTKITHLSINSSYLHSSEELETATQIIQSNKNTLQRISVFASGASEKLSSFFENLAKDGIVGITHLFISESKGCDSSETLESAAQWIQSNERVFQGISVAVSRTYKALIPFFRSLTNAKEITHFDVEIQNGSGHTGSSREIWGSFTEALAALQNIRDLSITWWGVQNEELSVKIIDGLTRALDGKRLKRFRAVGFVNIEDLLFDLSLVLSKMPLEVLDFTEANITDDGAKSIAAILSGGVQKTIETLLLGGTRITNKGLHHIALGLSRSEPSSLRMMSIAGCQNIGLQATEDLVDIALKSRLRVLNTAGSSHLWMRNAAGMESGIDSFSQKMREKGYVVEHGGTIRYKEGSFFLAPQAEGDADPNWMSKYEPLMRD